MQTNVSCWRPLVNPMFRARAEAPKGENVAPESGLKSSDHGSVGARQSSRGSSRGEVPESCSMHAQTVPSFRWNGAERGPIGQPRRAICPDPGRSSAARRFKTARCSAMAEPEADLRFSHSASNSVQRRATRFPSGRSVERQWRRKGTAWKHVRQLSSSFTKARGTGAKSVDEGAIGRAKLHLGRVVASVDERSRAAVRGRRLAVRILREDGRGPHRLAALLLVFSFGLRLNFADDATAFGLALVDAEVLQTRQRREPHIEGSGELRREDGLATLAGAELGTAIEPCAAQKGARRKGGDAIWARPCAWGSDESLFGTVGEDVAKPSVRCFLVSDDDRAVAPGPHTFTPAV